MEPQHELQSKNSKRKRETQSEPETITLKVEALRQDAIPDFQRILGLKVKHVSRNIPPYDAFATTTKEVYVLDKIILKGEWDYLEDIYNILQREEATDFKDYPVFIRNRIDKVKNTKDESEKKRLCCIFSYMNHLINFKDRHSMNGVSFAKSHKIPNILRRKFTKMFDVSDSRGLSPEKINLLISYILVLTLFIDEFKTDYKDIIKDLRVNRQTVMKLYKNLGCKISTALDQNKGYRMAFATLHVPLKFPD